MAKTKKQYSPEFKLKAVIEILKGEKTATQIAGHILIYLLDYLNSSDMIRYQ